MSHAYGSAPDGVMAPPAVVLPERDTFARRARRLHELSEHVAPLGDFLAFMARLAQAQHQALESVTPSWQPASDAFTLALEHGMAPLGIHALQRDVDIHSELVGILDALEFHVGEAQRPLLASARALSKSELDALASEIREGRPGPEAQRGLMPLVAAAMQVAWVRLAQALPRPPARPADETRTLCPTCGSGPVASVIRDEADRSGARYLQCGLCATQWYLERVRCSVCEQTGKLRYLGLEDDEGERPLPIQAETCGDCHSYLKILPLEFDVHAEALADDLASLALDLTLDEEGEFKRSGFNPLLIVAD